MKKRLKAIILLGVVLIIASLYGVDKLHDYQVSKHTQTVYTGMLYRIQNEAFELDYYTTCYLPYSETEESRKELQINFNAFKFKTGKDITVEDVKEFLKEQYNADGSPKTYKNDTGIVSEYVEWYSTCNNYWNGYRDDMIGIIARYSERYNITELSDVSELSIEQINTLCSLYTGDVDTYPYDKLREAWEKYDEN